jgi:prostaglandin-H2 D-isomerase / glutathione transferase
MAKLKLTYFDFHGGRGEVARIALSIGRVPFEDERIPFSEWPGRKAEAPFHALPVLEVDGVRVTQSNAINRYVGKLADLYPSDPLQALSCDEVMDAVEDITVKTVATFSIENEEEKRTARKALVEGPLTLYLERLEERLVRQGGEWFAGGRISIADLKVFVWVAHLKSGKLDHVPTDLPDRVAPNLVVHLERVRNHRGVRAYYAKHGASG